MDPAEVKTQTDPQGKSSKTGPPGKDSVTAMLSDHSETNPQRNLAADLVVREVREDAVVAGEGGEVAAEAKEEADLDSVADSVMKVKAENLGVVASTGLENVNLNVVVAVTGLASRLWTSGKVVEHTTGERSRMRLRN
jgi:hypothetical protein